MDIVDRLFELVDKKFNEQQEFAALLGVDPTLPSRWRNRKSTSYQRRLPQIAEALGTTTEYLLTGNGPKKKTAPAKRSESDAISDDDIKAAFFEGAEDLTKEEMDALWADARDYMRYKLEQRRKQQQ
ncbi:MULTISPECIES: helix-turn-helix domain-containing protein [Oscillospiraceae]|jgi:bacteriophage CI repressor helix-turn-helix domain|uniref:helix-turn-helix domain-containing protein n=1 Tax=Oscillospiraceae TaxID=216572 RepID=UPI00258FCEF5|nr:MULTISPECIES: helix-turn-helix domain-containing protein [Oscillospiraceae]